MTLQRRAVNIANLFITQPAGIGQSADILLCVANHGLDIPVSYTHLTLPTTPYV